jgi:fatty acid CoA ligase FadD36
VTAGFAPATPAVVTEDGRHRIVGRISVDLIKTGGYRFGAGEIEAALLDHPSVQEVTVVGKVMFTEGSAKADEC